MSCRRHITRRLLRVQNDFFVAGAEFLGSRCVRAAPIIRWMESMNPYQIFNELLRLGATYQWFDIPDPVVVPILPADSQPELVSVIPEPRWKWITPEVIRWRDHYISLHNSSPDSKPDSLWNEGKRGSREEFLGFGRFLAWFDARHGLSPA